MIITSYVAYGASRKTAFSAGKIFFSWSQNTARAAPAKVPAGYVERRTVFPAICALSRSNWPTKKGWSTRS